MALKVILGPVIGAVIGFALSLVSMKIGST
jgi:hypothetical protein